MIAIGSILPQVLTGIEWIWLSVMKIAQITSVYISVPPKTHGGTERVVYHLCQQLDKRGHQVELFASGDSQVNCRLQSVLPIACQDDPHSTFYLEKEFETRNTYDLYRQAERFEVIHAHWPTLAPYFSVLTTTPTLVTYGYIEKELHEYYRTHFPHCLPVCVSQAQEKCLGTNRFRWFITASIWTKLGLTTSRKISSSSSAA